MKLAITVAALALAIPATANASATHNLAWHPNGKTPAAIQQPRAERTCAVQPDHHRGAKGPLTPVVRCSDTADMAKRTGPAPNLASGR